MVKLMVILILFKNREYYYHIIITSRTLYSLFLRNEARHSIECIKKKVQSSKLIKCVL